MNGPGHGPVPRPGWGFGLFDAVVHAIGGVIMGAAIVLLFTLLIAVGIVFVRFLLAATKAAEVYVADHRPVAGAAPATGPATPPAPTAGTPATRPARAPRAPRPPRTPPPGA
jgi:hypothetical protein